MFNLKFSRNLLSLFLLIPLGASVGAARTTVVFNPSSVSGGPFPTNALTVSDNSQVTGLRVKLQESDTCGFSKPQAVCTNYATLNTLDGFSLNPRIMVCFSGPVDPNTLQSGITINPVLRYGHTVPGVPYSPVAINQVMYDPSTNCAFAKPDSVLAQDAAYLLVITNSVTAGGQPVTASADFNNCLKASDTYCQSLQAALASSIGMPKASQIVAASVFTTMTATAWAQAAHAAADATPAIVTPAGVLFGSPSVFKIKDINALLWNTAGAAPPTSQPIDVSVLQGVGQIAFGLFESINYLDPASGSIALGPSTMPLKPLFPIPVSFHVLLPSAPPPPSGYPVLIWGHGLGDNQFGASSYLASTFAKNGFAVLTIEVTGQGFGPKSTVTVTTKNGTYTEATPGRGVVLPGNTYIGGTDGCVLPGTPIGIRDCSLQTVADLSAIVHDLKTSAVQSVLHINLDPDRIYYGGQSEGAIFGTVFNAVEPGVRAAMLSVGGGTSVDIARLAVAARPLADAYAMANDINNVQRNGAPPQWPFSAYDDDNYLNDNYVFRGQGPVVNTVAGAPTVQAGFEAADWIQMIGDPLAFAPHLKLNPLPGVNAKPVLFLFSEGDLEVPNPTNSALIRAAGIQSTSWSMQFDQVIGKHGQNVQNYCGSNDPHTAFSYPTIFSCGGDQLSIALAEQQQAATFLASDGAQNPNPNTFLTGSLKGTSLFVVPATLPDTLNYFQLSQ